MTTTTPTDAGHRPAADAVRALSAAVARVHTPGSQGYARLTTTQNPTTPVRPALVVEPTDAREVAATLRLAAEIGVPVAVQGTGHGVTDAMTDAVLVHTAALDTLTVDPVRRRARVGAGVRWSAVIEAAAPHGLAPVCGSSTHVGVVGYLTGGGVGPLVRSHGLSSDHVVAFEVVTGDGVVRRASRTEHPDLFWGLRGGKGTLGIVTEVELDLPPLAHVYGGGLWFAAEATTPVVRAWSVWSELLPTEATTSLAVLRLPDLELVPPPLRGRTAVCVRFVWTGAPDEGADLVRVMRTVARPLLDTVDLLPYAEIGTVHGDPEQPLPTAESTFLLEDFGPEAVERFLDLVGPHVPSPQLMVEVRHLGGRLHDGDDCAFAHREAPYTVFTTGIATPQTAATVADDARRVAEGLAPWGRSGALPNFATDARWTERAYPAPVAARLRELSRTYDPAGVLLAARALRA